MEKKNSIHEQEIKKSTFEQRKKKNTSNSVQTNDKKLHQKYIDNLKRFLGETVSRYGSIHRHILVDCRATTIHHIDAALRLYCSRDYHFTHDGSGCDIRRVYNQENLISYMTKDIDRRNLPNLNIERDKVIDSVNSDIGKNHYSVSGLHARENINQLKKTFENLYKSDGKR